MPDANPPADGMKPRLRVGLLLDSYEISAWELTMFRKIAASDYADIALIVLNSSAARNGEKSVLRKIIDHPDQILPLAIRRVLFKVYDTLVDRNQHLPDANARSDSRDLFADTQTMEVAPRRTDFSDYFPTEAIEAIRSLELDVLIRSGFRILRGDVLHAARHGVWSFHHGDNRVNRGGPPGYWESMEAWPATGSVLQILSEDLDNGLIVGRSISRTNALSLRDSRSNYYWKSLHLMTRALQELQEDEDAFYERIHYENRHPTFYSKRLYREPSNAELAGHTTAALTRKAKRLFRGLVYFDQWILLFHLRSELSSSLWRYQKIVPPRDRFWADPHVLRRDGRYYIFFEEYLYRSGKGRIAVMAMSDDGGHSEPVVALELPYHLSYPFVFEWEGQIFMVPETMENRTIELYRCTRFPTEWTLERVLMNDVRAVDTTLFRHQDRWWMFTSMASHALVGPADDELFLFSSATLVTSDWRPHPQNPIVSDCGRARPAGKLFTIDGRVYRPSQNCALRYGYGFNLNEVTRLDEDRYDEGVVSSVEPDWDPRLIGTHTFNRAGRLHVVDALYRRRRF